MSDPEIIFSTINREKPKQNHNCSINLGENSKGIPGDFLFWFLVICFSLPAGQRTFRGNSRKNPRRRAVKIKWSGRDGRPMANRESRESIQIFWLGQY